MMKPFNKDRVRRFDCRKCGTVCVPIVQHAAAVAEAPPAFPEGLRIECMICGFGEYMKTKDTP